MDDNLIKMPEFDDLLFELRNKDYGAYQLRKRYNSVVIAGIIVSSLLFSSAVILPFILAPNPDRVVSGGLQYVQVRMEHLEPPKEEIIVLPAPPPPETKRIQEIVKYIPPVVVDSILPLEKTVATNDEILSQSLTDPIEVAGTGFGNDFFGQDGGQTDNPFVMVEVMPSFKGGGLGEFRKWVGRRTNYPQAAYDNKIRGTVFLTFIVEKDGSVSNVTVIKGVDPLLDNEAVKAISESPRWTPGLQRGQPVRVRFQIPLNFMF
ncbi:MAG TPA: TonB family protein [Bacteroidales bacterium]|nr:TonB family protein [Bacteroidales bacterium]